MPLVVTVVFCGIFYNENGINPYSSFAATIMLSFAIMGWSVHSMQKQEALEEQILILQSRGNELLYYVSRLFFFLLCDLFFSFLILLIPCLFYLINGAAFTLYPIRADMLFGYFNLHVSAGLCGGMMITLLHPRIVSNQKLALPLACMLIIAGYAAARNICLCISSGFRYQYPKCKMDTGAHEGNRHIHIADAALCCCLCNRAGTNTYETKIRIKPCFITRYFQS